MTINVVSGISRPDVVKRPPTTGRIENEASIGMAKLAYIGHISLQYFRYTPTLDSDRAQSLFE